LVLISVRG